MGGVDREQQHQAGDERAVGQTASEENHEIQTADDDPVVAMHDVVHRLLQRDRAGAEAHRELLVIDADLLDRSARGLERRVDGVLLVVLVPERRSEEHTSELQSLMRISYAVFCLKKKI